MKHPVNPQRQVAPEQASRKEEGSGEGLLMGMGLFQGDVMFWNQTEVVAAQRW